MQDVCISFWNGKTGEASSDMMLKVTDVCTTDPKDPTHCAHPGEIKVDRSKVYIMEKLNSKPLESYPSLTGNEFTDGESYWFFAKCWADVCRAPGSLRTIELTVLSQGLVLPSYADNWFAKPKLPNDLGFAQNTATELWRRNQIAYPLHNPAFPKYINGAYNPRYDSTTSPPIPDRSPSDPDPEWCPVAAGNGWGIPTGKNCGGSQQPKPAIQESSTSSAVSSAAEPSSKTRVSSTFGSKSTSTVVAEPAVSSSVPQETSVAALTTSSSPDVAVIPSSTSSAGTSTSFPDVAVIPTSSAWTSSSSSVVAVIVSST